MQTQEQVSRRIMSLSGFDHITEVTSTILSESDDIPISSERLVGKPAWQGKIMPASLALPSIDMLVKDKYQRHFTATILKATGQLVSIQSRFSGIDPDMRPEPPVASAIKKLKATREVYVGLPDVDPKISFLQALDIVATKGIGNPYLAKEIDGIYVMQSSFDKPPSPVWIIMLRGIPRLPSYGIRPDTSPLWQVNHIRNVVDANTGVCKFATNVPHPD